MDNYTFKKDASRQRPKNISKDDFDAAGYGDQLDLYSPIDLPVTRYTFSGSYDYTDYKKIKSLKNTINYYFGTDPDYNFDNIVDKPISMLCLSSYHLGSGVEKGTVALRVYNSSSVLLDSALDSRENGILYNSEDMQVGFVLYREGFIILTSTGSITSSNNTIDLTNTTENNVPAYRWHHYAASSSLKLSCSTDYSAISDIATNLTMVYADKGELNHSNNPTYLESGSYTLSHSDQHFTENTADADGNRKLTIKNTVKSPFVGAKAPPQKQTFISKIGLYDSDKKLVAIASLSKPIKKTENREFLFKLKLDT
jgi:hypothetical protein